MFLKEKKRQKTSNWTQDTEKVNLFITLLGYENK